MFSSLSLVACIFIYFLDGGRCLDGCMIIDRIMNRRIRNIRSCEMVRVAPIEKTNSRSRLQLIGF